MNRTYILTLVITALLSVGGTFWIMHEKNEKELSKVVDKYENKLKEVEKTTEEEFVSIVDTSGMGWENPVFSKQIDEWKSGDEAFPASLVEEVMQEMAHQKVIAKSKEGSVMITPERIDTLIQMVEENKDKYERRAMSDKYAPYELYLDILQRWEKSDFSMVDYDHNVLMYIRHTELPEGLATGIASEEQEKDYIYQVFGKEVKE